MEVDEEILMRLKEESEEMIIDDPRISQNGELKVKTESGEIFVIREVEHPDSISKKTNALHR